MTLGTYVVDETWRFDIDSIALAPGGLTIFATMDGTWPAIPEAPRQVVIYDPDGREVVHVRVGDLGWGATRDGTVYLTQLIAINEAIPTAGDW